MGASGTRDQGAGRVGGGDAVIEDDDLDVLIDLQAVEAESAPPPPPPPPPPRPPAPDLGFFPSSRSAPPARPELDEEEEKELRTSLASRRVSMVLRERRRRRTQRRAALFALVVVGGGSYLTSAEPWKVETPPGPVACARGAAHIAPLGPAITAAAAVSGAQPTTPSGFLAAVADLTPSEQSSFNRVFDRAVGEAVHATDPLVASPARAAFDGRASRGSAEHTGASAAYLARCFELVGPAAYLG